MQESEYQEVRLTKREQFDAEQSDKTFDQFITFVNEANLSDAKVRLSCLQQNGRFAFVTDMQPEDFDFGFIQKNFGAGRFRAQLMTGNKVEKTFTFEVAEGPKAKEDTSQNAGMMALLTKLIEKVDRKQADPQQEIMLAQMREQAQSQREQAQMQLQMMMKAAEQNTQLMVAAMSRPNVPVQGNDAVLIALIQQMGKRDGGLLEAVESLRTLKEIMPEQEAKAETWADKLLTIGGAVAQGLVMSRGQLPPPSPDTVSQVTISPPATYRDTQNEKPKLAMNPYEAVIKKLKSHRDLLLTAARNQFDPQQACDVLDEQLTGAESAALAEIFERENYLAILFEGDTEIAGQKAYFDSIREAYLSNNEEAAEA